MGGSQGGQTVLDGPPRQSEGLNTSDVNRHEGLGTGQYDRDWGIEPISH